MNCAKCSKTRLQKVRGATQAPASSCPRCGGLWIADGKALGWQPPAELALPRAPADDADRRAGQCPNGHGILRRAQTHLGSGFYLDRCSACLGVWFDHGEWQQIAAAGLTSGLFEIWSESWQRDQRRRQADGKHRRRLREELGSEVVESIEALAATLRGHPSRSLGVGHLLACLRGEDG
ncbi:MAG: zf-TFIIB domain-containing protein [Acidobacteriota bacterium]